MGEPCVLVVLPLRLASEANMRGSWKPGWRRGKAQRATTALVLRASSCPPAPPVTVTLTRIAPRRMDGDNLQRACKAVRDGVADWLGIDDGSESITWRYGQEKGKPRQYGVRVEVSRDTS